MGRALRIIALAAGLGAGVSVAAEPVDTAALINVLDRAGERVEHYFTRAQSIVCLEVVRLLPLNSTWGSEGPGRTVESELRMSWSPDAHGAASPESQSLRQVLRVNGRKPREDDWRNCTEPEQQTSEPQPLALLLSARRGDYEFKLAGRARLDNREAILIDYRLLKKVSVDSQMIEGRDDCVSFNVDGGKRGRLWIDPDSYDVMRMDENLIGMVEIPLPKRATRGGAPMRWTLERMDTSIRFKPVAFTNPDETLVLPATVSSLRITRGSGTPRLRTMTDYTKYQRFLTGARVIGN
jgi:hypothetical protein